MATAGGLVACANGADAHAMRIGSPRHHVRQQEDDQDVTLTRIAFIALAAIAAGGLLLLTARIIGIKVPRFVGPAHGLGGCAALILLAVANFQAAAVGRAWWALAVFAFGFLGGVMLFRMSSAGTSPIRLAAVHGATAALGLYLLYGATF